MNEYAILHRPDSKFCFAKSRDTLSLRIRFERGEPIERLDAVYGGKYEYATVRKRAALTLSYTDRLFDYYTCDIKVSDVRFMYVFEISAGGKTRYYSEDGLTDDFCFELAFYNAFQLPYINEIDIHRRVEWTQTAVVYQIFVDRFCRGDFQKDGSYINLKWGEKPSPKSFAGGDLAGITQKLGYIESLGVNAIYLTPIFSSISNHKYDIRDYKQIDRQFGSNEDFKTLVKSAHERGIRIVLDAVFNHCSDKLPQFADVVKNGKKSAYYDWFIIDGEYPVKSPRNYECFASCDYMPKFDTSNPEVQAFLIDIALYWIREFHIDGWRLDVSDEISHAFWRRFRDAVKAESPDCVIIGENWHDAYPFLKGDQYDSIMNYAFTKACLDLFAFQSIGAEQFSERLNGLLMRNTDTVNAMMLNLLDTHDTHRFLTQLKGDENALRAAIGVLFFYTGIPCIYYGTEINMLGGFDPDCRRTFDWEKAESKNPTSDLIKALATFKKDGLLYGDEIKISAEKGCVCLRRKEMTLILCTDESRAPIGNRKVLFKQNCEDAFLLKFGFVIVANH